GAMPYASLYKRTGCHDQVTIRPHSYSGCPITKIVLSGGAYHLYLRCTENHVTLTQDLWINESMDDQIMLDAPELTHEYPRVKSQPNYSGSGNGACIVADPTGTPLNVRSRPNGTILGALHNDTKVIVTDSTIVSGKVWSKVVPIDAGKT